MGAVGFPLSRNGSRSWSKKKSSNIGIALFSISSLLARFGRDHYERDMPKKLVGKLSATVQ